MTIMSLYAQQLVRYPDLPVLPPPWPPCSPSSPASLFSLLAGLPGSLSSLNPNSTYVPNSLFSTEQPDKSCENSGRMVSRSCSHSSSDLLPHWGTALCLCSPLDLLHSAIVFCFSPSSFGLKLLASSDPPTSASKSSGITGMSHCALKRQFTGEDAQVGNTI